MDQSFAGDLKFSASQIDFLWAHFSLIGGGTPDVVIGGADDPYLRRWYIRRNEAGGNIYLHQFLRDDDDRALHDHPWPSRSLILRNSYTEIVPVDAARWPLDRRVMSFERNAGDVIARAATAAHRVVLKRDSFGEIVPCWSLFFTGPWERHWGFHCPNGWRSWQEFCAGEHGELIGRGCA